MRGFTKRTLGCFTVKDVVLTSITLRNLQFDCRKVSCFSFSLLRRTFCCGSVLISFILILASFPKIRQHQTNVRFSVLEVPNLFNISPYKKRYFLLKVFENLFS